MIYLSFDIGVKNLAMCVLKHHDHKISVIDWEVITLVESKKQVKGVNNIANILFHELDNIVGKLQTIGIEHIDNVMIENQPSNLNGIMKTIQYLIFSYFDLLRHWDAKVTNVILVNPSLKLQFHTFEPSSKQITEKLTRREKYKYNKSDGIEICTHYIRNNEELKQFFKLHKKKDDLADTCLQTVAYIRKNGDIIDDVSLYVHNFIST